MKEAQVLHLLQLQSIELLHVGNKQTQLRDKYHHTHTHTLYIIHYTFIDLLLKLIIDCIC